MTTASTEVSDIDTSARWPLSLLIAFGLLWLLVSGALALVNFGQTFDASLFAECPVLTFGHTRAMQETAFIYGWVGNAGLALALWLLGRLGGSPLRSLNWAAAGAVFWNIGVLLGLVGIVLGDGTSVALLHMPRYVQPLLLVSFAAVAMPGVLAWTGRAHRTTFATQWYAVAALFLFPWLFSGAQVMLMWAPLRGVVQAVAAGWFVQGAWTLWIAPLALAAAYYLVPKITGRVLPNYDFAALGFWTLLVVGGWTGARHLIGGPVPAWIPTIAIVASMLLLFHYIVVAVNLRGAFRGGSVVLSFVAFGLLAYVIGGFADAVLALRSVAVVTQFTWVTHAMRELAVTGSFSMIAFGAIYFLMPRIANHAWPSTPMIRAHFAASLIGIVALVAGLAVAGVVQGRDLAEANVTFADIAVHTRPWLGIAMAGQAVFWIGNLVLAFHFLRLLLSKPAVPAANLFREPAAMEASV